MRNKNSYNYIYGVQRLILIIFFLTTTIALSIPLMALLIHISGEQLFPVIAGLVIYIVLVIFVGSLIHVISYIPFHLAAAFDPIKNDIAEGNIKTTEDLATRLTSFTTDFYDFAFLDLGHVWIETEDMPLCGHEDAGVIKEVVKEYGMLERSKEMEEITLAGKVRYGNEDYQMYIMPLWVGKRWLGYMILLSRHRIKRFFLRFLDEYEENFLDDQILHLVNKSDNG